MPTEQEIEARLRALKQRLLVSFNELQSSFLALARQDPSRAMDRHGLELAETQEALARVGLLCEDPEAASATVTVFENELLQGRWTTRTACPMADCLSQARLLARCKLIRRLREVLQEDDNGNV